MSKASPLQLKPQSHRIIRFLDRTIGCGWTKVRPIGNVCYDLQQRSHAAIDLYAWSRYHERLQNIDGKSHHRKSCEQWQRSTTLCTLNRDGRRPMVRSIDRCILRPIVRAIVASCDRSYEHSWHPVTRRPMVRSTVGCNDRSHDQSQHRATDRTINRC